MGIKHIVEQPGVLASKIGVAVLFVSVALLQLLKVSTSVLHRLERIHVNC